MKFLQKTWIDLEGTVLSFPWYLESFPRSPMITYSVLIQDPRSHLNVKIEKLQNYFL